MIVWASLLRRADLPILALSAAGSPSDGQNHDPASVMMESARLGCSVRQNARFSSEAPLVPEEGFEPSQG